MADTNCAREMFLSCSAFSGTNEASGMSASDSEDDWSSKVPKRKNVSECIIHCTDSSDVLIQPKSLESSKTLLAAATTQSHNELLKVARNIGDDEIGNACYHRRCRSNVVLRSRYLSGKGKDGESHDPLDGSSQKVSFFPSGTHI